MREIKQKILMSKKLKKSGWTLNCNDKLLILISPDTKCVSIFCFASLICIAIAIVSVGLKVCIIGAVIKNFKSVVKKERNTAK